MRDVAALAGVGLKTVSRVVNQESGVSPELVGRVLDAVRLLDYRHNMTASSLRRADRKTATIGLLLEDVSNPFSSALHRAVEDVARQRNILVFAGSSDLDRDREREVLLAFVSRRVDGLIVVPAGGAHTTLLSERRFGTPMVFVDRPGPFPDTDSVTVDNRGGAQEAVRRLAAHGHQRIAFLGDLRSIWTAAERHLGYLEGLAIAGIQLDQRLVRMDIRSSEAAESAALDLLGTDVPPSALFAGQNLITIGAVRALRRRALQHRVAIIGFDEFPLADLLDPPVSVLAQNPAAIGQKAAELLLARLDGDGAPAQHVVLPTRFIPRGSDTIPPSWG